MLADALEALIVKEKNGEVNRRPGACLPPRASRFGWPRAEESLLPARKHPSRPHPRYSSDSRHRAAGHPRAAFAQRAPPGMSTATPRPSPGRGGLENASGGPSLRRAGRGDFPPRHFHAARFSRLLQDRRLPEHHHLFPGGFRTIPRSTAWEQYAGLAVDDRLVQGILWPQKPGGKGRFERGVGHEPADGRSEFLPGGRKPAGVRTAGQQSRALP